jgi:hypothetical protein
MVKVWRGRGWHDPIVDGQFPEAWHDPFGRSKHQTESVLGSTTLGKRVGF